MWLYLIIVYIRTCSIVKDQLLCSVQSSPVLIFDFCPDLNVCMIVFKQRGVLISPQMPNHLIV